MVDKKAVQSTVKCDKSEISVPSEAYPLAGTQVRAPGRKCPQIHLSAPSDTCAATRLAGLQLKPASSWCAIDRLTLIGLESS